MNELIVRSLAYVRVRATCECVYARVRHRSGLMAVRSAFYE